MKRNALLEFAELTVASTGSTSTAWMNVGKHQQGPGVSLPEFLALTSAAPTGTSTDSTVTVKLEWAATDGGSPTAATPVVTTLAYPLATAVAGFQIAHLPVLDYKDEWVKVTVTVAGTFTTVGKMKFAFVPNAQTAV